MSPDRVRPFDIGLVRGVVSEPSFVRARECLRAAPVQALAWDWRGESLAAAGYVLDPTGQRYRAELRWDGLTLAFGCPCSQAETEACAHGAALALTVLRVNPWRQDGVQSWQSALELAMPRLAPLSGEQVFVYRLEVRTRPGDQVGQLRIKLNRTRLGRRGLGQQTPFPASRLRSTVMEGLPSEERALLAWLLPLQAWNLPRHTAYGIDPRFLDVPPPLAEAALRGLSALSLAFLGDEGELPVRLSERPLEFRLSPDPSQRGALHLVGRLVFAGTVEKPLEPVDVDAFVAAVAGSSTLSSPSPSPDETVASPEASVEAGTVECLKPSPSLPGLALPGHLAQDLEDWEAREGWDDAADEEALERDDWEDDEFLPSQVPGQPLVEVVEPELLIGERPCFALLEGVFYPVQNLDRPDLWLLTRGSGVVVPIKDLPVFLESYVPALERRGIITSKELAASFPEVVAGVKPSPILTLEEQNGQLVAHLSFRYGPGLVLSGGGGREVEEIDLGERRLFVQRDRAEEASAEEKLLALGLTETEPGRLETGADAALRFLLQGLPELLSQGWMVEGEERLERYRPSRTPIRVRGSVQASVGWFDVALEAVHGDDVLPMSAVFQAWQAGRRFIKFGNGEQALLPEAWLSRNRALLTALFGDQGARSLTNLEGEVEAPVRTVADPVWKAAPYLAPLLEELALEGAQVELDLDSQRLMEGLRRFGGIRPVEAPEGLMTTLRDYQLRGLAWLCFLREHGLAGILADDMGLGKTVQALALLLLEKARLGEPGCSLVVAPTSVLFNWEVEARRFAPSLRLTVLHGPARHAALEAAWQGDVVVTSYTLLRRDLALHQEREYHYVILDEAQLVKNPDSQTSQAARSLRAHHRLTLTGTPIENRLAELWSQFAFLMPGLFPELRRFLADYIVPVERDGDKERLDELRRRIYPFVLRRMKEEVASELPPRTDNVLYCELDGAQRRLYQAVLKSSREKVRKAVGEKGVSRARFTVLDALLRLRQICCHPGLLRLPEALDVENSAKLELFRETLLEILSEGHRALVFSQFVEMLTVLRDVLEQSNVTYEYLDGRTRDRQTRVERFNAGSAPVFLISLKAGGTGLNLASADYVIHYDPWWNPAVEDQATDRAYRIGQTRPVFSYKLIARDTVEEKILVLQERKRVLARELLSAEDGLEKALSEADLEFLFADPTGL